MKTNTPVEQWERDLDLLNNGNPPSYEQVYDFIKSLLEKQRKDDSQYVSFGCKQLLQTKDKQHQTQREDVKQAIQNSDAIIEDGIIDEAWIKLSDVIKILESEGEA